ncbi:MAG: transcription elongation factor GreA [bacterium]
MALGKINITEDGLNKIKDELKELEETRRPSVIDRIQKARELGDLSENAEYSDAKEEQGFVEGRIAELRHIINNAEVVAKSTNLDIVSIGSKIKVHTESEEEQEFTIVGANEADPSAGRISEMSPIGKSLLGRKVGELVEVHTPKGTVTYKILIIE